MFRLADSRLLPTSSAALDFPPCPYLLPIPLTHTSYPYLFPIPLIPIPCASRVAPLNSTSYLLLTTPLPTTYLLPFTTYHVYALPQIAIIAGASVGFLCFLIVCCLKLWKR